MRRFTSEVLGHLKRRIKQFGRAQDVKLWLEYIEGWIPKEAQISDQQINVIFKGIDRPKPLASSSGPQIVDGEAMNPVPIPPTPDKKPE